MPSGVGCPPQKHTECTQLHLINCFALLVQPQISAPYSIVESTRALIIFSGKFQSPHCQLLPYICSAKHLVPSSLQLLSPPSDVQLRHTPDNIIITGHHWNLHPPHTPPHTSPPSFSSNALYQTFPH